MERGFQGKGVSQNKWIDAMQNFYGRAIRDNKGDAKSMAQATKAILQHDSSTVEKPQHEDCRKVLRANLLFLKEIQIKRIRPISTINA